QKEMHQLNIHRNSENRLSMGAQPVLFCDEIQSAAYYSPFPSFRLHYKSITNAHKAIFVCYSVHRSQKDIPKDKLTLETYPVGDIYKQ
ncbi:hypothetical protein K6L05_08225, partial [Salinicoccus roseus]|uniref:hypothetical protein n=1 Tax=Salinicoccus roseus TaxID=45670 RepID=UPI001CA726A8